MLRVAIINDTRPTHHYGCMLVMANLIGMLNERGVDVVWTWPVSVDWRKHKRKLLNRPKVDAIIVNGEGTIHHSAERKYARALAELALFAKERLGINSYLVNATLYQNDKSAYGSLKHYKSIYVRDSASLDEVQPYGLEANYVPDLTLAKKSSGKRNQVESVAVIGSAIKSDDVALRRFAERNGFDFRSMVVARPSNANFFKHPRPFVKNIFHWLRKDRKVSTDPEAYIEYLSSHKLVITGRYHTVTMCLKNRIPFVALQSNTPKIGYLLEDSLQDENRIVSLKDLDNIDINLWDHFTEEETTNLENFLQKVEKDINGMVDDIVSDIEANARG